MPTRTASRDHSDYLAFVRRILRASSKRIGAADPDDLAEMLALRDSLDESICRAVAGLRATGFSWGEIADATGTTRQAAHARWAGKVSVTLAPEQQAS